MLISIIIPVYNSEEVIDRTIQSVLNQPFKDYEMFLVNDGSKDNSGEIIDRYAEEYPNIYAYHQVNQGVSAARNKGIKEAKGDYILFIDSDDEISDEFLTDFIQYEARYPMDLFIVPYAHNQLPTDYEEKELYTDNKEEVLEILYTRVDISFFSTNMIYNKRLFDHFLFPEGKIYEDNMTTLLSVHYADHMLLSNKPSYIYHQTKEGIVKSVFKEGEMDNITERIRMIPIIEEHYPALYNHALSHLHTGLTSALSKIASIKDRDQRNKYAKEAMEYVKPYEQDFASNPLISAAQRSKYHLFKLSPTLYHHIYRVLRE